MSAFVQLNLNLVCLSWCDV